MCDKEYSQCHFPADPISTLTHLPPNSQYHDLVPFAGKQVIKLKQTIESIMNGGAASQTTSTAASDRGGSAVSTSRRSAGRRVTGRRRRERLVLPNAVESLASSSLFREALETFSDSDSSDEEADRTELTETVRSSSREQSLDEVRRMSVDQCMRHLRVPSGHRYAWGRDVALVVGRDVIHGVAEAWERIERKLMVTERG